MRIAVPWESTNKNHFGLAGFPQAKLLLTYKGTWLKKGDSICLVLVPLQEMFITNGEKMLQIFPVEIQGKSMGSLEARHQSAAKTAVATSTVT